MTQRSIERRQKVGERVKTLYVLITQDHQFLGVSTVKATANSKIANPDLKTVQLVEVCSRDNSNGIQIKFLNQEGFRPLEVHKESIRKLVLPILKGKEALSSLGSLVLS